MKRVILQQNLSPQIEPDDVAIVQLGRYGDIVNMLPIAMHVANEYKKPWLVVADAFADILDGVSYVQPFIVYSHYMKLGNVLSKLRPLFPFMFHTQISADDYPTQRMTESYSKEMWRVCGMLPNFNDFSMPVFDKRDLRREKAQFLRYIGTPTKPLILTCLTGGESSPFDGKFLIDYLRRYWGSRYEIVDISDVRLFRIYDLLGFIERAAIVISIDTAVLHLASATSTPTIALVNPAGWAGTSPRNNAITYSYDQITPELLGNAIRRCVSNGGYVGKVKSPPKRAYYHVVPLNPNDGDERKTLAKESWKLALYDHGVHPRPFTEYTRFKRHLGTSRRAPYWLDAMLPVLNRMRDNDVIIYTNDDNILHPGVLAQIRYYCSIWGCVAARRCELPFGAPLKLSQSPGEWVGLAKSGGLQQVGRDLFAFTKLWWVKNGADAPDFLISGAEWDNWLAVAMRKSVGYDSTFESLEHLFWPAEMPMGYVAHYYHKSYWMSFGNFWLSPVNLHNRKVFKKWAHKRMPSLYFDEDNQLRPAWIPRRS